MKKFLLNILLFCITGMVLGELVSRGMHLTSDIPRRTIDENHIQKYLPDQKGFWKGGEHSWSINKMGWPGGLPQNFDHLQLIIGDSFIENFMNPQDCHQSVFLKQMVPGLNFMEAGRSGISLIEAMEIARQLDTLNPEKVFFYVKEEDFLESIRDIKVLNDITQLSIKEQKVVPGEMKSPGLKRILYNWKFLYYLYNRFPIMRSANAENSKAEVIKRDFTDEISGLLGYITKNYNLENKVLVFMPGTPSAIIEAATDAGIKTITLSAEGDKSWSFDYDSHWTCYGHKQAAKQVADFLNQTHL